MGALPNRDPRELRVLIDADGMRGAIELCDDAYALPLYDVDAYVVYDRREAERLGAVVVGAWLKMLLLLTSSGK